MYFLVNASPPKPLDIALVGSKAGIYDGQCTIDCLVEFDFLINDHTDVGRNGTESIIRCSMDF